MKWMLISIAILGCTANLPAKTESKAEAQTVNPHKMNCPLVAEKAHLDIYRCENAETICYVASYYESKSMQCRFKNPGP